MNTDEFSIDACWPEPPAEGARDVAELRIRADESLWTRILDLERKEERSFIRSSAVSLAIWFADNWWRLRHESLRDAYIPPADWRLRHELTSASGGTFWPPLMIHSTGARVLLTPAYGRPLDAGALRYLLPEVRSVSGAAYEKGLDAFFAQVLGACALALDGPALASLLEALKEEREDSDMAGWRRLEARLGFDPDEAPDTVMCALMQLEKTVGEAGVDEAAAASPGGHAAETLEKSIEASKASEVVVDLGIVDGISRARIRAQAASPWRLAREAAHQVREAAHLADGPISTASFADLFQATRDQLKKPATARALPYATRLRTRGGRQQLALQSSAFRDRRFELACALGDAVWDPSDFGVVSKAKTDRQKFQRAFAQNLLAPYADVRQHIDPSGPTEEQIERAAGYFHVHPHVIERLLMIEGVIPGQTFEERLEAA